MDFRAAFEMCGVPLLVVDDAGHVGYANVCARERLGDVIGARLPISLETTSLVIGAQTARIRVDAIAGERLVTVLELTERGHEAAIQSADHSALGSFGRRLATQRLLGVVLANARELRSSLTRAIEALCSYDDWDAGGIWLPHEGTFRCDATWIASSLSAPELVAATEMLVAADTSELVGRVAASGRAEKIARAAGLRRAVAFPIFSGDRVLGVAALATRTEGSLDLTEIGLLNASGQMLGLFIERMRAEERLQLVIDTLYEGIIIVDDSGEVLYFNPRAKQHYGFVGDDAAWLEALHASTTFETRLLDGTLVPADQRPTSALRRGEPVDGLELWVKNNMTGVQRAVEYSGARLPQPDGSSISVVAFSDITSRVHNAAALVELNETLERRVIERTAQLEAANRELEAFTYTVSHDLRTPIRSIISFTQIVLDEFGTELSDEPRRMLQRVQHGGVRLHTLVDDLLAFSHLGRQSLRCAELDLTAIARGVVEQLAGDAANVDAQIGDLGSCFADVSLLEQVWINLIGNALKYSRTRDRIVIAITRRDTPTEAWFSVRDNGVGFDERFAKKLFGVFQRLHANDSFEGNGVGLATVRRIVERHGGHVAAHSTLGEGSTFEFSLPVR